MDFTVHMSLLSFPFVSVRRSGDGKFDQISSVAVFKEVPALAERERNVFVLQAEDIDGKAVRLVNRLLQPFRYVPPNPSALFFSAFC